MRLPVLIATGATALTLGATAMPAPATVPAQGSAKARTTVVTLRVQGCAHCTIQPVNAVNYVDWSGHAKRVGADGIVRFWIPRRKTRGLHFQATSMRWSALNARVVLVTKYAGKRAGSNVTDDYARKARFASPCFAGTRRSRITWNVRVRSYRARDKHGGGWGRAFRMYTTRTKRSMPPMLPSRRGTVGAQDYIVCG